MLKANFSSVRISAMEDFIGRGDRRIGAVIRRAWEAGATNDSWWESEDTAFAAWSRAIEESGLGWKYREVSQPPLALSYPFFHSPPAPPLPPRGRRPPIPPRVRCNPARGEGGTTHL